MPRMIDLIRKSEVPSALMQSAAKGALSVSPEETIEILVHLATQNKVFAESARLTLAGWDEAACKAAAANPETPTPVLDYFIDQQNLRPALLPILVENPSLGEKCLMALAVSGTREQAETLLKSQRVNGSREILAVLVSNPNLSETEVKNIQDKMSLLEAGNTRISQERESTSHAAAGAADGISSENAANSESQSEAEIDATLNAFLAEHAAEIAVEAQKPFHPMGETLESLVGGADEVPVELKSLETVSATSDGAAAKRKLIQKKSFVGAGHEKGSALKKIAQLDIKGRIQLAMKGSKEDRSLLIRDGTKVVALAVLESPKVTDGEVEHFASQKNVLEAVLRAIPMKRRFMKQYPVVRNLTFNPRTPIDVSLGLLKNLLLQDLRNLSGNREVSDTVRKLATKMFRQKLDVTKK